jgi:hypothetical protein
MPKRHPLPFGAVLSLVLGAASTAKGGDLFLYPANPTGLVADTSNPLDGIGDSAGPGTVTLGTLLNANDPTPTDRRAALEVYLPTTPGGLPLAHALLEFEVHSYNSQHPVNIFLYGGDGLITPADYGRTANLVFSGALTDPLPEIDVTSALQGILNSGNPWVGVLIGATAEDQTFAIYNTGAGAGATEPRLKLKVLPEPATLALVGILSLLVMTPRRRS